MIAAQKIAEIGKEIGQRFQPAKVILFGSYVWGEPEEHSDIDLLVIKKTENTRTLSKDIDRALFPRVYAVDLMVYTPQQVKERVAKGDQFITQILEKGRVLYGE